MKIINEQSPCEQLKAIEAYPEFIYQDIDLTGLASFIIYWLQERHIQTTFENIVVALYKMFPTKFALEGYPDYPDAARVGRTLLQLGPKYRNWARGSVQKGFTLTESGLAKADRVRLVISSDKLSPHEILKRRQQALRTMDLSKELAPLEQSPLLQKWKEGKLNEGSTMDLLDMIGGYAYSPLRVIQDRIKRLQEVASQVGRNDLVEFMKSVMEILNRRMGNIAKGGNHA
jgi:hypothetical protein